MSPLKILNQSFFHHDLPFLTITINNNSMVTYRGERDRSPLRSKSPTMTRHDRRRGFDYDDPRALAAREDEILRQSRSQADLHVAAEMTRAGAPQVCLVNSRNRVDYDLMIKIMVE